MKTKKDSKEAIAKFKLEADQAKAILKKHKEAAKKLNNYKEIVSIRKLPGLQNKQLETEPWNILRWVRMWTL